MKSKAALYPALLAGVMLLSTSGIFARLASAPPSVTAFYRLLFAVLGLLPVMLYNGGWKEVRALKRNEVFDIVAGGFFLAAHYTMWFQSLKYTTVSAATTLAALQPLYSMVLGAAFLGERVTRRALFGCAVALLGTFIIGWGDFRVSGAALWGDILAAVSGGLISVYYFYAQLARRSVSAMTLSVLGYSSSVFFLGLFTLFSGVPFTGYSAMTWKCFLGLAFVSTIGGQVVFNVLLRWLSATMVTMSILAEPVGTSVLAVLILHETVPPRLLAGMAVILTGLLLYFKETRN